MIDAVIGTFLAWLFLTFVKVYFFDRYNDHTSHRANKIQRRLFRRSRYWKGTPKYCSRHINTKKLRVGEMAILDNKNCIICKKIKKIEMLK